MKTDVMYVDTKLDKDGRSERYQRESVVRGILLLMRLVTLNRIYNRLQSPITPGGAIEIVDSARRNDKGSSRHQQGSSLAVAA